MFEIRLALLELDEEREDGVEKFRPGGDRRDELIEALLGEGSFVEGGARKPFSSSMREGSAEKVAAPCSVLVSVTKRAKEAIAR